MAEREGQTPQKEAETGESKEEGRTGANGAGSQREV